MGSVQTTVELPVDFSLRRVELDFQPLVLRLCQLGTDDDQSCDDAGLAYFSQCTSPLCQEPQPQRRRVPKQEISERPLAKMDCEQVGEELWLA